MELTQEQIGTVHIVAPAGEIDANSSPQLDKALRALIDAGVSQLVVDMSKVSYTSSAGLRAVLWGLKQARAKSGDLRLAGLQPQVKEVFDLAGFLPLFRIFDSADLAAKSF
jgi:anti-sigma B factor antagonist